MNRNDFPIYRRNISGFRKLPTLETSPIKAGLKFEFFGMCQYGWGEEGSHLTTVWYTYFMMMSCGYDMMSCSSHWILVVRVSNATWAYIAQEIGIFVFISMILTIYLISLVIFLKVPFPRDFIFISIYLLISGVSWISYVWNRNEKDLASATGLEEILSPLKPRDGLRRFNLLQSFFFTND